MKKIFIISTLAIFCGISFTNSVKGVTWNQKNNFTGNRYGAFGFAIGQKGYVGSGYINTPLGYALVNDFWEYDKASDQWTQKVSMPGVGRGSAATFTGFGKGYVTTGYDMVNYLQDTWQYDPVMNAWNPMPDFPGSPRVTCASFTVSDDGYVGMGKDLGCLSDFYRFDGLTNTWNTIAPIPGTPRQSARGFNIDNFGYVVGGAEESGPYNSKELWCYSPITDTWTQKSDYPGGGSHGLASFAMNGHGFVGCGTFLSAANTVFNDFYDYDPTFDTWTLVPNFGGGVRQGAVSMSIGNTGFVGMGADVVYPQINYFTDWWSFDNPTGIETVSNSHHPVLVYYNNGEVHFQFSSNIETKTQVHIFDGAGKLVSTNVMQESVSTFSVKNFHPSPGIYYYNITNNSGINFSGKIAISL